LRKFYQAQKLFNEHRLHRPTHTEEGYLLLWQSGEADGFAYFFARYKAPLIVFATAIVKDPEAAKDLVQACFIKLWQRKPPIESPIALRSYFYRAVYHHSLNYLQTANRRAAIRAGMAPETEAACFFDHMTRAETLRHLYAAMKDLPPQCAKIVQMYYDEGKDYKTIAEELRLSINTVRNQRKKGIDLLKKRFPHLAWTGLAIGMVMVKYFYH
jgi:RNA polymerase sigma-70 factor (family 1)